VATGAVAGGEAGRELPGRFAWVYVGLAALAALTVFLGRGGRAGLWLTLMTLAACLATATLGFEIVTGAGRVEAGDEAPAAEATPAAAAEPLPEPRY
jgi:hypothetical protein